MKSLDRWIGFLDLSWFLVTKWCVCVLNVRKGYGAWNLGLLSCAPEFSWPDLCFRDRKGRSTIGISITSKGGRMYFLTLECVSPARWTGWWFQFFLILTPTWGNDPIWLYNIFHMGWFNHQPVEALAKTYNLSMVYCSLSWWDPAVGQWWEIELI